MPKIPVERNMKESHGPKKRGEQNGFFKNGCREELEACRGSQLDSEANWSQFVSMFRSYGINDAEMVALMTVHGMFAAHKNVSGYSGHLTKKICINKK